MEIKLLLENALISKEERCRFSTEISSDTWNITIVGLWSLWGQTLRRSTARLRWECWPRVREYWDVVYTVQKYHFILVLWGNGFIPWSCSYLAGWSNIWQIWWFSSKNEDYPWENWREWPTFHYLYYTIILLLMRSHNG